MQRAPFHRADAYGGTGAPSSPPAAETGGGGSASKMVSPSSPASLFHTSHKRLHSTNGLLGVFCPAHPEFYRSSLLLTDANCLESSGPCGSQGPDPGERHAFDPWSQKEEQKEPNLLFSSFQIYISLSQTAWDHRFCLFIGRRRHPEGTALN